MSSEEHELIQRIRAFIQDNYADPANPTELEIALSEAIDDVEEKLCLPN